jgi:hypothetical protein
MWKCAHNLIVLADAVKVYSAKPPLFSPTDYSSEVSYLAHTGKGLCNSECSMRFRY